MASREYSEAGRIGERAGTVSLAAIYEPVRSEMSLVEDRLDRVVTGASPEMVSVLRHALKAGGKRIRPALTLLSSSCCDGDAQLTVPMAAAVELLHTATLLHDDTIDDAYLRRGNLTANQLWGGSNAVLLGDYLCAASARLVAETGKKWCTAHRGIPQTAGIRTMEILADTIMSICGGAIEESINPFNLDRDRYFQRIGGKTASLFAAAAESGATLSQAPAGIVRAFRRYGHGLGMGFQVVDDAIDFAGDLRRGNFTLPAIMAVERIENKRVKEAIEEDREKAKDVIAELVYGSSILDECYLIAQDYCTQACQELRRLAGCPAHDSLIDLAFYILRRKLPDIASREGLQRVR